MNNQTETHIHTCLLLNTGELISMREAEQRAAAEANFRSRLLGTAHKYHDYFVNTYEATTAAARRGKV